MADYYYGECVDISTLEERFLQENCFFDEKGETTNLLVLLEQLQPGDKVHVTASTLCSLTVYKFFETFNRIVYDRGADIVVAEMGEIDMFSRKLLATDCLNRLYSYVNRLNKEYEYRRVERQKKGIRKRIERGESFGRPSALTYDEFIVVYNKMLEQGYMKKEISEKLGISEDTMYRYLRKYQGDNSNGKAGRKAIVDLDTFRKQYSEYESQGLSKDIICQKMGMSLKTLYRYIKNMKDEEGNK